jgi:hypothetical protein
MVRACTGLFIIESRWDSLQGLLQDILNYYHIFCNRPIELQVKTRYLNTEEIHFGRRVPLLLIGCFEALKISIPCRE